MNVSDNDSYSIVYMLLYKIINDILLKYNDLAFSLYLVNKEPYNLFKELMSKDNETWVFRGCISLKRGQECVCEERHERDVDLNELRDLRRCLLRKSDEVFGGVVTNSNIVDQDFEVQISDGE
mgnify:CR=1 FL=1